MDEEAGKIFVGGLSWETSDDGLKNYFQTNFGEVQTCTIMRDQASGRSRGFGFVTFRDSSMVQKVLSQPSHMLDGRQIDPKAAVPRGSGPPASSAGRGGGMGGRGGRGGGASPGWRGPGSMDGGAPGYQGATKKIFIGGIGHGTTEEDIKGYFSTYGSSKLKFGDKNLIYSSAKLGGDAPWVKASVMEVIVKYDQKTNRMRGFGFVSFDNETAVERLCEIHFHTINGKTVEVKKAEPRQAGSMGGPMGGPQHYGMGRGGPAYGEAPYGYANTYAQPRGYPGAGYGAPQPYGSGYPNPSYGQAPAYPGPGGSGYGYGAAGGYGQSGPSYGNQYGGTTGYGPGPSQGYGSQAQASGYDSYGSASTQPSQAQDYSTSNTSTYNYGGAAGRMGGYGQDQSPYGTPQTGGYGQDRPGTYGGQPAGYGQTPGGGAGGPGAGSADATSYGQQAAGYGGDYRGPQSFGQGGGGGAPQQARAYGYQ